MKFKNKRKSKLKYFNIHTPSGNKIGQVSGRTYEEAKRKADRKFMGTGPYVI